MYHLGCSIAIHPETLVGRDFYIETKSLRSFLNKKNVSEETVQLYLDIDKMNLPTYINVVDECFFGDSRNKFSAQAPKRVDMSI